MLTLDQYQHAEVELLSARAKRGFKIHATIFAVVMTGQIILNALLIAFTDAKFQWVVFPLVGWGIGLACNYRSVYRRPARETQGTPDEVAAPSCTAFRRLTMATLGGTG